MDVLQGTPPRAARSLLQVPASLRFACAPGCLQGPRRQNTRWSRSTLNPPPAQRPLPHASLQGACNAVTAPGCFPQNPPRPMPASFPCFRVPAPYPGNCSRVPAIREPLGCPRSPATSRPRHRRHPPHTPTPRPALGPPPSGLPTDSSCHSVTMGRRCGGGQGPGRVSRRMGRPRAGLSRTGSRFGKKLVGLQGLASGPRRYDPPGYMWRG